MKKKLIISFKILAALLAFAGLMILHLYIISEDEYEVYETADQDSSIPVMENGTSAIHLETFGSDSNEVLVILHDGPGMDFRELLPLRSLAKEYFLVFYDQRGTGLSTRLPASSINMEHMMEDLHRIIHQHSPSGKVHLLAYKWGGVLAAAYISKHPADIEKIIIAEPWEVPLYAKSTFTPCKGGKRSFERIQLVVTLWSESLHISKSDPYASMDHFFTSMLRSEYWNPIVRKYPNNDLQPVDDTSYWRYGYIANRVLLKEVLDDSCNLRRELFQSVKNYNNAVLLLDSDQNESNAILFPGVKEFSFRNLHSITLDKPFIAMIRSNSQELLMLIQDFLSG